LYGILKTLWASVKWPEIEIRHVFQKEKPMKSKMIAFTAFFTVAAGFGAGGASASYSQVNPWICNEKNIYRNGNHVVASLTAAGLAKVRASADVEPKVRETIIPACPPTTQCGPDIARPTGGDAGLKISEIPACPSGTQCVPDIAPPSVSSRFDEGE
jgi:S-adenosylhomocysteine hydrolase